MDPRRTDLDLIELAKVRVEDLRGLVAAQLLASVSPARDVVIARRADQVVGIAASISAQDHRDLLAWWVDSEVRSRGVGGALLRWVLAEAAPGSVHVSGSCDRDVAPILDAYGFEIGEDGTWRSPLGTIRQAVRAVVTDPTNRVALVRFDIGGARFWNLPGGGIEAGETTYGALVRELHEELGFVLDEASVGPLAWHYLHWWTDYNGEMVRPDGQLERVHSVAAPTTDLEPAIGWAALAAEWVIDIAWWDLEGLTSTAERFATAELPGRIASAVASSASRCEPLDARAQLGPDGVR